MLKMKEYQRINISDEILQGDLFFIDKKKRELGVIITADCDISKNKTSGILAYLPVIEARDYITNILIYESTRELINKSFIAVEKKFNPNSDLTKEAINHIINMDADWLNKNLKISLTDAIHSHISVIKYANSEAFLSEKCQIKKTQKILNTLTPGTQDTPFTKFRNKIKGIKDRDDCLFINELSEEYLSGYTILLREIRSIESKNIFSSISASRNSSEKDKAIRFSKLAPVYKFWLSHNFGRLFSRVGLPTEYEHNRDNYLININ